MRIYILVLATTLIVSGCGHRTSLCPITVDKVIIDINTQDALITGPDIKPETVASVKNIIKESAENTIAGKFQFRDSECRSNDIILSGKLHFIQYRKGRFNGDLVGKISRCDGSILDLATFSISNEKFYHTPVEMGNDLGSYLLQKAYCK